MSFVSTTVRWQRRTLAGVLVLSALVFHRGTFDVFNTTKATVIVVGILALVAVGAVRVSRTRRLVVPVMGLWWALAGFAAALLLATVTSPTPLWSVVGRPGRHTGLAMYLLYALLLAVVVRLYRDESPAHLAKALLVAGLPIAVYGLAQAVGLEPLGWDVVEGGPQVFATFGNANFFSAWLGIVIPLGVWAALAPALPIAWRAAAAVFVPLALAACLASDSLQGPAAAVAGSLLVGGVWVCTAGGRVRRWRSVLLGGGAAAVVALVGAVASGAGPFAGLRQGAQASLGTRLPKWEAALAMARDRPVFGAGLDNYGSWFFAYRPAAVAAEDGLGRTVDSAHNVPLEMLVSGGIPLLVAYGAVVVVTAWALVVGLRRLEGAERLLLAGFGGAWVAYQAQSLVSIDVPPLAVLHWVLAGVIVAVGARPAMREWALPGAPPVPASRPGRKRKSRSRAVPLAPAHPAALAGLGVALLGAVWLATVPVRADAAAMEGVRHGARGDAREATDSYRRASDLAPWEPRYPEMLAGALNTVGRSELAYAAYREAAERDPRGLTTALNLARVATAIDRPDEATRWYSRALEIDPTTPEVLVEVGRHRLDQGDDAGARQAFERALEVDPDEQEAAEGLERLALSTH